MGHLAKKERESLFKNRLTVHCIDVPREERIFFKWRCFVALSPASSKRARKRSNFLVGSVRGGGGGGGGVQELAVVRTLPARPWSSCDFLGMP